MQDSKPISTPLPEKVENQFVTDEQAKIPFADVKLCQEMVGSLIYVSNNTRPDIAYSVQFLARAMSNPTKLHHSLARRVIQYLNTTKKLKLVFEPAKSSEIVGCSDSDFAECRADRRSVGG